MVANKTLFASAILLGVLGWVGGDIARAQSSKAVSDSADFAAAEKIFKKSCRGCHGNRAQGAASYPKLSDMAPDDIARKLELYRAGEKIGPNSILMIQQAKRLSDEDIANISAYVATAFD